MTEFKALMPRSADSETKIDYLF